MIIPGGWTVGCETCADLSLVQARVLLQDPAILLLDEATASIDPVTEAQVQAALATVLSQRTSIIIAHRLSTIRDADLIVVMEAGRIVERGTHAELLVKRGAYWSMTQA